MGWLLKIQKYWQIRAEHRLFKIIQEDPFSNEAAQVAEKLDDRGLHCLLSCQHSRVKSTVTPNTFESIPVYGNLSSEDLHEITCFISNLANIDPRIMHIAVLKDCVVVQTGELRAPLSGGGNIIYLRKNSALNWELKYQALWAS